jgi:PKD repeat protein
VTQSCISDPSNNDFVAHQRVARQTGGKTLRAAYDNEFATAKAPGRACLAAASTSSGVNLTWKTPDHGGSAISSYTVVKQPVAGGSPTLIPVSKTTYLDSGANAADFVYSVKASNATGTGLASNAIGASGSVEEPEDVCTVPGVTVASDAEGDDNPPLPTAMAGQGDILSLKVSEPRGVDDKLVFTLKVASLESLPPNVNWYVNFLDPAGKKWFVSMQTDETSTASFNYGDYSAAQSGISQTIGDADASSGYTAETGEIKLVIAKSLVGGATAGQTLTQVQATTYQLVGLSQVGGSLQTIDSSATGSYTLRAAAACSVNTAPKATLAASTQMGEIPLPVRFTVGVSDVDAGDTLHYTLNFGDGSSPATGTTSGTVDHTYSAVGDYVATLTVTDAAGATDVAPVQIKAQDSGSTGESNEIVATLSANKTGGEAPIEITFNAAGSKYADGSALRSPGYTFVFGDGTNSGVLSSATTSHNYTAAGTYRAYVMVTDEDGNVDSSDPVTIETTVTITVGDDTGTVAQLTVDNASGPAPLTVTFDGSRSIAATGRTITNYTFDFDDGTPVKSGTAASVTHTYTVPGSYHPKLTVTDSEGTQSEAKADVGVVTPGTGGGGGGSNGGSNKKGGAMGWLTLLPFVGVALLRRRRQR